MSGNKLKKHFDKIAKPYYNSFIIWFGLNDRQPKLYKNSCRSLINSSGQFGFIGLLFILEDIYGI